jgi:hypothetical protein
MPLLLGPFVAMIGHFAAGDFRVIPAG